MDLLLRGNLIGGDNKAICFNYVKSSQSVFPIFVRYLYVLSTFCESQSSTSDLLNEAAAGDHVHVGDREEAEGVKRNCRIWRARTWGSASNNTSWPLGVASGCGCLAPPLRVATEGTLWSVGQKTRVFFLIQIHLKLNLLTFEEDMSGPPKFWPQNKFFSGEVAGDGEGIVVLVCLFSVCLSVCLFVVCMAFVCKIVLLFFCFNVCWFYEWYPLFI